MLASKKQLACCWHHFRYYAPDPDIFNLPKKEQKRMFLERFNTKNIENITRYKAHKYIGDIRLEERWSVRDGDLEELKKDWGLK